MPETTDAAMADLRAAFDTDLPTEFSPSETHVASPPTPKPAASTELAATGNGATATDASKPETLEGEAASDAPSDDDAPVTLTKKEIAARVEEATKRQRADQSRMARELADLKAEREQMARERDQLHFDNQVLFQAQAAVKRTAREQGAVGYADVDEATNQAIAQQSQARQQYLAQSQIATQQSQAQTAAMQQESASRTANAREVHAGTVAAILESAIEAGQKVTRAEAETIITAAYADPLVAADLEDWQDLSTPSDKSAKRLSVAFGRIKELAIGSITAKAVAQVNAERPPLETYNRAQVHGEVQGTPTGMKGLTPAQRREQAMAEVADAFDHDVAKYLTPIS